MAAKKRKKTWIIVVIVLAALAVGAFFGIRALKNRAARTAELMMPSERTYVVERGTVEKSISASGTLTAADEKVVELPDGLKVAEINVKVGDAVKAGDPLVTLDPDSIAAQFVYETRQLVAADNRLTTRGENDTVLSPCKARVKLLYAVEGDEVRAVMDRHQALAVLSTDGYMAVTLTDAKGLAAGDKVTVEWAAGSDDTGLARTWEAGTAKGTVEHIGADGSCRIVFADSHAPYLAEGTVTKDGTALGTALLTVNKPVNVYGYGGIIDKVECHIDESVSNGKIIYKLREAPATTGFELRYGERKALTKIYDALYALYSDPHLVAPCDGVVSEIAVSEATPTGGTDRADKLSKAVTLAVGGNTLFVSEVNELDILTLSLGQSASVTFDAMPDETFYAVVSRISATPVKSEGSALNYVAELSITNPGRLLAGMKGTASVVSEIAENALMIPVEAIGENANGEFVTVVSADGTRTDTPIVTSVSDGLYAAVVSGLNEGDTIVYKVAGLDIISMMMMY